MTFICQITLKPTFPFLTKCVSQTWRADHCRLDFLVCLQGHTACLHICSGTCWTLPLQISFIAVKHFVCKIFNAFSFFLIVPESKVDSSLSSMIRSLHEHLWMYTDFQNAFKFVSFMSVCMQNYQIHVMNNTLMSYSLLQILFKRDFQCQFTLQTTYSPVYKVDLRKLTYNWSFEHIRLDFNDFKKAYIHK